MSLALAGMRFIGVEMDAISGRIARALHPGHDIRIENFRDTKLPEGRLDAVIGNVPFADLELEYRGQKLSLHDYFFAKSIDGLRPGGILALVTSHFTMDKVNGAIREYLASKADFVGAIRLPSDAFKREGTAVVTDIIFLRKRAPGEPAKHMDAEWLEVAPITIKGVQVPINRYFLNHYHDMVLGTWSRQDTLYGEGYSVKGHGNLAQQLAAAIRRLPEFPPLPPAAVRESPAASFTARRRSSISPRTASSSPMTAPSVRSWTASLSGSPAVRPWQRGRSMREKCLISSFPAKPLDSLFPFQFAALASRTRRSAASDARQCDLG